MKSILNNLIGRISFFILLKHKCLLFKDVDIEVCTMLIGYINSG